MANKKTASSTTKTSVNTKPSTTNVTTVKAVVSRSASARSKSGKNSFVYRLTATPMLAASLAELLGAFLLTAVILTQSNQPIPILFAAVGIVLIVGGLSGAHLNPIATIGSWATKRIDSVQAVAYLIAQVLGAMLALVVLNAFVSQAAAPATDLIAMGQASPAPALFKATALPLNKEWVVLSAELLGATILGLVYASALRVKRDKIVSAFTVGLGYFVALVVAGTAATTVGASVVLNPAAAIAVQALDTKTVWPIAIYVFTSIVGGVVGFGLYELLRKAEQETE